MKIVNLVLTYVVAAMFVVLGAGNYFFHFMPDPPMTEPSASWIGTMHTTHFLLVVKILELIGGLMLAFNFKRALGWAILLPVIVNIAMFEVFITKAPGMGIVLLLINLYFVLFVYKDKFKGIWS